jgi:hypothetical protein
MGCSVRIHTEQFDVRNHDKADGRVGQKFKIVEVTSLPPALASIKGGCKYLGGIGESKFYQDLLSRLDVVKLGARTFVTVASLDRLIVENRQQRPPIEGEPHPECESTIPATGNALSKTPHGLLDDQGANSHSERPAPTNGSTHRGQPAVGGTMTVRDPLKKQKRRARQEAAHLVKTNKSPPDGGGVP